MYLYYRSIYKANKVLLFCDEHILKIISTYNIVVVLTTFRLIEFTLEDDELINYDQQSYPLLDTSLLTSYFKSPKYIYQTRSTGFKIFNYTQDTLEKVEKLQSLFFRNDTRFSFSKDPDSVTYLISSVNNHLLKMN